MGRVVLGALIVMGLALAWSDPITLLIYASYAAVGGILALRRPRNPIGWLVVLAAFGFAGTTVPLSLDVAGLQDGTGPWREFISAWVSAWATQATFGSFVALALMFGLQAVLSPYTANNTLAVARSTLVAAALFQPLRARVQRAVDRRFNRARVDAQRAADSFATRVREDPDLGTVHRRLLIAATGAVHPQGAAVWIRGEGR